MSTSHNESRLQSLRPIALSKASGPCGPQPSPKVEAEALLKLVRFNENTVETIRELIAIPAETEERFRSYAARYPEDETAIERVIEFRRRVREEFDRLVRASESRPPLVVVGGNSGGFELPT